MKKEIIEQTTYSQAAALHEVYSNLIAIYEEVLGGPRNCRGLPEYHAAMFSQRQCEARMAQISNTL